MQPPPRTGGRPVINIRNTSSPHWPAWLGAENHCLVLANSFAEHAPEPDPETKKKDVVALVDRVLVSPASISELDVLSWPQGEPRQ